MKTIEKPLAIIYTSLFILLALIVFMLTMSGCVSERIEGNRDLISEERTSQSFSEVVSLGSFNVSVMPATETRIVVKAESNILPYLTTSVAGSTLTIGFRNGYNIQEHYPVEIFLYTPDLNSVRLSGSGKVECGKYSSTDVTLQVSGSGSIDADFITEHLDASISGSGNMTVAGSASNSELRISGSGDIRSHDLIQEICTASISGSGNIITAVNQTLNAHISGSGCIYYLGNPVINQHISGSGKVIKY
jgi:hypothetical protein